MKTKILHGNTIIPGNKMICFIGERPGNVRKNCKNFSAFYGNKSGDFIQNIVSKIKDKGYILMNVVPYRYEGLKNEEARFYDTEIDFKTFALTLNIYFLSYKITDIVCLGEYAIRIFNKYCRNKLKKFTFKVHKFPHPSYVLRFNLDKNIYEETILKKVR